MHLKISFKRFRLWHQPTSRFMAWFMNYTLQAQNDLTPTKTNSKQKLKTMKKISILFSLVVLLSIASLSVSAQVTATATASATIITPIAITKNLDMSFGNVAVSAIAGTVTLTPANTRTIAGGVTLPLATGTVNAAKFTVTGLTGSTYSITLPSTALTLTSGGNTMTVTAFTSTPTPTGTLTGGTEVVYVGATLNVGASQAAGTYTSAAFPVTVNYN